MTPVLQRPVAVAIGVLLGLLLLSQMTLVISSHSPHVLQIVLIIFGWILLWVLLQDLDNLPPAMGNVSKLATKNNSKTHSPWSLTRQLRTPSAWPILALAYLS